MARRLAGAVGTLFTASALLFLAAEVLPGDAAAASLGGGADAGQIARMRAELGLDRPLVLRYLDWVGSALDGDLGTSTVSHRPVGELVTDPLLDTLLLVVLSVLVTVVVATSVGVLAGLRPGSALDRLLSAGAVALVSIPQFVTASVLVLVFASALGVLPAVSLVPLGGSPLDDPAALVLPVAALSLFSAAWASRMVRASVVEAGRSPHVESARLAGLPEHRVVFRHLLPTTIGPCLQAFAWLTGALVGGTAVVERVFNYPGLSAPLVSAVVNHDTAVLEGIGLLLSGAVVVSLLLADLLDLVADPHGSVAR
ncbi:ABC transporter permease [Kitasatospora griseola]